MKKVFISEQQEKFLREQKGLLFEYFAIVSNPRKDTHTLGNLQVWIYGDDRNKMTPHCHVMTIDKDVEFEVSLIDWSVVNVKQGTPTKDIEKRFHSWLQSKSTRGVDASNKKMLYIAWDENNPNNDLYDFVKEHQIEVNDKDLKEHIERAGGEV